MLEIWGIPSLYKSGPKKHIFGRLRNSTATLTANIFGIEHDADNQSSTLTTVWGLLDRPQMS